MNGLQNSNVNDETQYWHYFFTLFPLEQRTRAGHGPSHSVADSQPGQIPGLTPELLSIERELIAAAHAEGFGHLFEQGQQLVDAPHLQEGASESFNISVPRTFAAELRGQNWSGIPRPISLPAAHSAAQALPLPPQAYEIQLTLWVSIPSVLQGAMPHAIPALYEGQRHHSDLVAFLPLQTQDWSRFPWPGSFSAAHSSAQAPRLPPPAQQMQLMASVSRSSMLQGQMPHALPEFYQGRGHQSELGTSSQFHAQDWSRFPRQSSLHATNSSEQAIRFPLPTDQVLSTPSVNMSATLQGPMLHTLPALDQSQPLHSQVGTPLLPSQSGSQPFAPQGMKTYLSFG